MLNDIVNSGLQLAPQAQETTLKSVSNNEPKATDVSAAPEQQAAKPEPQQLQSAVSKLNDYVQNIQRTLSFSIEEETGVTVVKVFDSETDELIRQIPAEETIKLAATIEAPSSSLLLQEQA